MSDLQTTLPRNTNVFVDQVLTKPFSKRVGCYYNGVDSDTDINSSSKSMETVSSLFPSSFEQCEQYAANHSFAYFGLSSDNHCFVSNDLARTTQLGDASTLSSNTLLWSSNTANQGVTRCTLTSDGCLVLTDVDGNTVWSTPAFPSLCSPQYGGLVNPSSIQGSCAADSVGNLTSDLQQQARTQLASRTSTWTQKAASSSSKAIDYSYQCGLGPFKTGQLLSAGANLLFDCSSEALQCSFCAWLQNDGTLAVCQGNTPFTQTKVLWSSTTTKTNATPNTQWQASNGKMGRNFLAMNDTLGLNEWIGSDDGSFHCLLQQDGNLAIFASQHTAGCSPHQGNTTNVNAVFQLHPLGDPSVLGQAGSVDSNGVLTELPSLTGFTTDYQIYQHVGADDDSDADPNSTVVVAATETECQQQCNQADNCRAYVYQPSSQTCWLKSSLPLGTHNPHTNLGIRKPAAPNGLGMVAVDSVQFNSYKRPNAQQVSEEKRKVEEQTAAAYAPLRQVARQLGRTQAFDHHLLSHWSQVNHSFSSRTQTPGNIQEKEGNIQEKEAMTNLHLGNNKYNNLNNIVTDTSLRVVYESYQYALWSVLALGVITFCLMLRR